MAEIYYPEMGEKKPEDCQMESTLAHYGKHYFIDTPLGPDVIKGRGIVHIRQYEAGRVSPRKVGWHEYKVTIKAYEKLEQEYRISHEVLLD